jgi:zinc D-Ala-D-Ala carboxypeptidase
MNLSKNLSLKEVTRSQTAQRMGLANSPTLEVIDNLRRIARNVFQPLREAVRVPIYVSSGYRGTQLNKAINGSKTSQHCTGHALDIDADVFGQVTNTELFDYIRDYISFDQLIWEFGDDDCPDWVHVSYVSEEENRCRVLRASRSKGRTVYSEITNG